MPRNPLSERVKKQVVASRKNGETVDGIRRPVPINVLRRRFKLHGRTISRILKEAGELRERPQYGRMSKRRGLTLSATPRLKRLSAEAVRSDPPDRLISRLTELTPQAKGIWEKVQAGQVKALSQRETAELCGLSEGGIFHAQKKRDAAHVLNLPRIPAKEHQGKTVDAGPKFVDLFKKHQKLVMLPEARAILTTRYGFHPDTLPQPLKKLVNRGRKRPGLLMRGAFDLGDFRWVLEECDAKHGSGNEKQMAIASFAKDPQDPHVRRMSRNAILSHADAYLRRGFFNYSDSQLAAIIQNELRRYDKSTAENSGRFWVSRSGEKRSPYIGHNTAALAFLGIPPGARIVSQLTHDDRRVIGNVLMDLVKKKVIPPHFRLLQGDEGAAADLAISQELRRRANVSAALEEVSEKLDLKARAPNARNAISLPKKPVRMRRSIGAAPAKIPAADIKASRIRAQIADLTRDLNLSMNGHKDEMRAKYRDMLGEESMKDAIAESQLLPHEVVIINRRNRLQEQLNRLEGIREEEEPSEL